MTVLLIFITLSLYIDNIVYSLYIEHMDYAVNIADQLKEHLKGLRKRANLTQAELGQRLGVSQSRVADIEANPGLVNIEQMLRTLQALDSELVIRDRSQGLLIAPSGTRKGSAHLDAPLFRLLANDFAPLKPRDVEHLVKRLRSRFDSYANVQDKDALSETNLARSAKASESKLDLYADALGVPALELEKALQEFKDSLASAKPGLNRPANEGSW
jgi:HTH-type transcriptional regulator/antitoxin HipB